MSCKQIIRDNGYVSKINDMRTHLKVYAKVGFPEGCEAGKITNYPVKKQETGEHYRQTDLYSRMTDRKYKYTNPKPKDEREEKDMTEIIQIAATHEFGSPARNIPERSFLRSSFDEMSEELQKVKAIYFKLYLQGRMTIAEAIGKVAHFAEGKVKAKVIRGPFTPLFPETIIARNKHGRASSKPLIDTAQMINSIQSVVVENKPS